MRETTTDDCSLTRPDTQTAVDIARNTFPPILDSNKAYLCSEAEFIGLRDDVPAECARCRSLNAVDIKGMWSLGTPCSNFKEAIR